MHTLTVLPYPLAICRLGPDQPVPAWAFEAAAVTRTPEESYALREAGHTVHQPGAAD